MILWKTHNAWYKDPVDPFEYHPIKKRKEPVDNRPTNRAQVMARIIAMEDGDRRQELMARLFTVKDGQR